MKKLVLLLILPAIISCSSNTTRTSTEFGQFVEETIASDTVMTLHSQKSTLFARTADGVLKKLSMRRKTAGRFQV